MGTKEDMPNRAIVSADEDSPQLGPAGPIRTYQDVLDLSLATIDAQRRRVARALAEEAKTGRLDKTLSVEIKRLNAMLATYGELVNTPQAKAATQPRAGTGAVSQILTSLAPKKRRSKHTAPAP